LNTGRHKNEIHIGFIGTRPSVTAARDYLLRAAEGVDGDDQHAPFPGCNPSTGYRMALRTDEAVTELITRQESEQILKIKGRRQRFEMFLGTLEDKVRLLSGRDHPLDYVVVALSDELYRACRVVDYFEKGIGSVHRDLRRAFKAMAMRYKIATQILLDSTTVSGSAETSGGGRKLDHPSVVAWNLFTGMYFKAEGLPWAPSGLPPGSCFIGISFFRPLARPVFQDTRLSRCDFRRSGVGQANFEKCDLIDLKVSPPKRSSAESLADFYKRLRVAFQSQGERGEASHFYYNERLQRLRGHVVPLIPRVPGLPGLAYSGPLITLYEQWQRGQMTLRHVVGLLAQNCVRVLKMLLYPPYFLKVLWEKLKVIPELFDWLVWGFGERPARVFAWMILAVGAFTLRYYLGTNEHLRGNLVASLSCSAYNFSTIGCDYRGRFNSMEAICGAVLLGIMVAGFSNRARY
jgi:hypothetical protein